MNESVSIKEGNIGRRLLPVDKLKINTTDNNESMWIPTGNANTCVLHASENGIYIASEDGYEAYSEVIVRVTKDSFEGDTSFDDWDYETPDMDLENWDPETIEDFELDPDGFDDVFNNEDEWKDINKPIGIKMDNPNIQDTKISGIDPVTGNEMEVGLDEDGYLTESILPSSIKIVVPPDKHQYVDGQPILFRGMIVKAYTADGELWTDENHPDGVIPHPELTFPITTAYYDGDSYSTASSDMIPDKFPFGSSGNVLYHKIDKTGQSVEYTINGGAIIMIMGSEKSYRWLMASNNQEISGKISDPAAVPSTEIVTMTRSYEHNNKTVYYHDGSVGWGLTDRVIDAVSPDASSVRKYDDEIIAWTMIYGDITEKCTQTIPVQYIRSDGEVLDDSFTIEVLPDPDGAHPQVDPSTVEWNHRRYKANEDLGAVEVRHGSVYMEGGAIYDVGAAVRLGMLEPVDNEIVP